MKIFTQVWTNIDKSGQKGEATFQHRRFKFIIIQAERWSRPYNRNR